MTPGRRRPRPVPRRGPAAAASPRPACALTAERRRARERRRRRRDARRFMTGPGLASGARRRQLLRQQPLQLAQLVAVHVRHRVFGAAARGQARFARGVEIQPGAESSPPASATRRHRTRGRSTDRRPRCLDDDSRRSRRRRRRGAISRELNATTTMIDATAAADAGISTRRQRRHVQPRPPRRRLPRRRLRARARTDDPRRAATAPARRRPPPTDIIARSLVRADAGTARTTRDAAPTTRAASLPRDRRARRSVRCIG